MAREFEVDQATVSTASYFRLQTGSGSLAGWLGIFPAMKHQRYFKGMANQVLPKPIDFSLVLGGPLYQLYLLYLRKKLARRSLELVPRRP